MSINFEKRKVYRTKCYLLDSLVNDLHAIPFIMVFGLFSDQFQAFQYIYDIVYSSSFHTLKLKF